MVSTASGNLAALACVAAMLLGVHLAPPLGTVMLVDHGAAGVTARAAA